MSNLYFRSGMHAKSSFHFFSFRNKFGYVLFPLFFKTKPQTEKRRKRGEKWSISTGTMAKNNNRARKISKRYTGIELNGTLSETQKLWTAVVVVLRLGLEYILLSQFGDGTGLSSWPGLRCRPLVARTTAVAVVSWTQELSKRTAQ